VPDFIMSLVGRFKKKKKKETKGRVPVVGDTKFERILRDRGSLKKKTEFRGR